MFSLLLLISFLCSVDFRVAERMKLYNMPLSDFSIYLYPRMFALHQLMQNHGEKTSSGTTILPPWQPLTRDVSNNNDGIHTNKSTKEFAA